MDAGARYQARYWHDRQFDVIEQLRALAAEAGMSMATMAVRWTLSNPAITAPIVGASRAGQLAGLAPRLRWTRDRCRQS